MTAKFSEDLLAGMRRLLGIGIIILAASSVVELLVRASEMSGASFRAIPPVLFTVLIRTHYGHVWMVRTAAIAVLWTGWLAGRRRPVSRKTPAFILAVTALLSVTMSATGHASDQGDFSILELGDWLHLLASLTWGGVLLALSTAVLPLVEQTPEQDKAVIASVGRRFSRIIFGIVMGILVVTALHKGWYYVHSFHALWSTPYGQTVTVKVFLFFLLLVLASYSEWYGNMPLDRWIIRFTKTVRVQVIVIVGVLLCAALLRHQIPARHSAHLSHAGHAPEMVSNEVIATLKTIPEAPKAGEDITLVLSLTDLIGRPLKGLVVTHERLIHMMVIREDFSSFAHIHPEDFGAITEEMIKDARFPLHYSFPKAGRYLLAVDTAVDNALVSKLMYLNIGGGPRPAVPAKDLSRERRIGDYTVSLISRPERIRAGEETVLTYTMMKGGTPVADLEPYLGATMHLAVVSSDLGNFIHTHGELPETGEERPDHTDMLHMKPPPPAFGPVINAEVVFPEKGVYKVFGEIKHRGRVLLLDFMIQAE
jgi:putative copper export protein